MKTNDCYLIFLLVLLISSSGCSRLYNMPKLPIPLMSKAGEIQASVSTGISKSIQGEIAISPAKNFSVIVSGNYSATKDSVNFLGEKRKVIRNKYAYIESGLGYYYIPPGNSKFMWEIYAGYGKGRSDWKEIFHEYGYGFLGLSYYEYDNWGKGKYDVLFIQGNIGFKNVGIVDHGLGTRLAYLNYTFDDAKYIMPGSVYRILLLETQYKMRLNITQRAKFDLAVGFSNSLQQNMPEQFCRNPINISTGFTYVIH